MSKRLILSIFICLIVTYQIKAGTGRIEGYVFNQQGNPISDVYISLTPIKIIHITSNTGFFFIDNLIPGTYSLELTHISYSKKIIDDILIQENKVTVLDTILLESQIFPAVDITVTASRSWRHRSEISYQINTISEDQIKVRNAKTSAEVLREETGISVQKTNHGGGSAIIRGLSSNQILILVDGIRLNNSTYRLGNHQYLTTMDNLLASQIEVVRGPTSVLYGSDALGGTINIISKTPAIINSALTTNFNFYSRFASADAEKTARAEAVLQNRKYALQTGFSYKSYSDLKRGKSSAYPQLEKSTNGIKQTPSGYSGYDFDAKILYAIDDSQILTLAHQFSRQNHVPRYDKYENDNYIQWLYHPQTRNLSYLKYDNYFHSDFLTSLNVTLSYHYQNEGHQIQESLTSLFTKEQDQVHTFGASMQTNCSYHSHEIALGGEFYLDKVYSERMLTSINEGKTIKDIRGRYPDDANYSSLGIYLQDEMWLTSRLKMALGARFSYVMVDFDYIESFNNNSNRANFQQTFRSFTGSLGAIYKINDNVVFKSHISQAFRAPNLSDLSKLGESKGNIYEVPNFNLKPEYLYNIDFGIDLNFSSLTVHTAIFYSTITNLIASADVSSIDLPDTRPDSVEYKFKSKQNIGKAFIKGIESDFSLNFYKNLSFYANITSTHGQNITLNEPVGGIPPTFGLLGFRWSSSSKYIYFYMRFADNQNRLSSDDKDDPRIPEGGTPAWKIFNIRTGFDIMDFSKLCFSIENIFDYNYREHGSGINGPGRNFILSMEFKF